MAERNPREMDVARSLIDMSYIQEGNQGQNNIQNTNSASNTPVQDQALREQPGRVRVARNRGARRGRRTARAPAAPGEDRVRATPGRNGRRLHVAGRPTGAFPAAMPPRRQHQPQVHHAVQGPAVNPEYTLQGHLIRQQLLAGILPENVVTLGGRGPAAPHGNAKVQGNGMPSVLQITNDGVFAPPLPPATFIPPAHYQIPHAHQNHAYYPPAGRWVGPQHQRYRTPFPGRPATTMGQMAVHRSASALAANRGAPTAGVPHNHNPFPAHRMPKKEEDAFAKQSMGIPEGIPAYQRSTSAHPAPAVDANVLMMAEAIQPHHQMQAWNYPHAGPVPVPMEKDPYRRYQAQYPATGTGEFRENNGGINPAVLERHLDHGLSTFGPVTTAFQGNATGYGWPMNYGSPAHPIPLDLEGYGKAPMAQAYPRPTSATTSKHSHDEKGHAGSFLEALNSDEFDPSVFIKDESGDERPASGSNLIQVQESNEIPHDSELPALTQAEPDNERPALRTTSAPVDDQAEYVSVKNEAEGPAQHMIRHSPQPFIPAINCNSLAQQNPPTLGEGSRAAPRLGEAGWYPALYRQTGVHAADGDTSRPATPWIGNASRNHSRQPMINRPVFPITAPVPQHTVTWIKQELNLDDQAQHVVNPIPARPVDILQPLLNHPEIAVNVTTYMLVQDLVNLQSTSRMCRNFVVKYLPMIIRLQAQTKFQLGSSIFPWRCYEKLWLRRVVKNHEYIPLTTDSPKDSLVAYTASFRWLQMVKYRERIVQSILVALEKFGCGFPRRYCLAIFKLWFLMDIPDTSRRLWTVRNANIWTDLDVFMAVFFITRIDMFVKIHCNNATGGQRRLIMAQPSLSFCRDVLTGRALRTNMEILNAMIRWRYTPRPGEVLGAEVFGVPAAEVGSLQYEGYRKRPGQNVRLQRPDELLLREAHRRRLNVQDMYRRIFMHSQPQLFTACERPNSLWDEEVKLATRNMDAPAREHLRLD